MHGRICSITFLVIAGCTGAPNPSPRDSEEQEVVLGKAFDAKATGAIRGIVRWDGDVPVVQENAVPAYAKLAHVPMIDAKSKGVAHAVVFLRLVDSQRSRPWDHAAVRVEFYQRHLHVVQGERRSGVGLVRRGSVIEIVNRDAEYHRLLGRGAAFFAHPLVEKDRIGVHTLATAGIVELSSGTGHYWLHAHLFVAEHPYYTCSDSEGRFALEQVPAGTYELVCWMPNWHVRSRERHTETGAVIRHVLAPPHEQTRVVEVRAGTEVDAEVRWTTAMFEMR